MDEGEAAVRALLETEGTVELYVEAVETFLATDALQRALTLSQEGLKRFPASAGLIKLEAKVAFRQDRFEDALRRFRDAERIEPQDADIQLSIGQTLSKLGRERQASQAYRKAAEAAPDDPGVAMEYAESLVKLREFDRVRELLVRALEDPEKADTRVWETLRLFRDGALLVEGLELTRALTKLHPDNRTLKAWEGKFLQRLGKNEEALPILEDTVKDQPTHWELGSCLAALGRHEAAVETLETILRREPNRVDIRRTLVQTLVAWGQRDWAREQLQQLFDLEPHPADEAALRALVA
jgi:tetratricopeptide (TPR) repeat protein